MKRSTILLVAAVLLSLVPQASAGKQLPCTEVDPDTQAIKFHGKDCMEDYGAEAAYEILYCAETGLGLVGIALCVVENA
ncbi:MAG TPA: hypothetical protein VNZ52_16015 [Candidatus Thermoplasmatota archaeon]|nr:hypothetical protein [Candidatus Thermoplasmatota archaeon]